MGMFKEDELRRNSDGGSWWSEFYSDAVALIRRSFGTKPGTYSLEYSVRAAIQMDEAADAAIAKHDLVTGAMFKLRVVLLLAHHIKKHPDRRLNDAVARKARTLLDDLEFRVDEVESLKETLK
ncbi:MAG: hypothetical protein MHM6MM_008023, partial [Cercozoa sp. M6MM]